MATYKVIQDIEAEDKFLGPLTLKQFIFGAIAVFFLYLSFFAVTKDAAVLLVLFLPFVFLGIFLAIPWSSQQSTEVWVLAKLRFMVKPRVRIWDQAGLEELVTITVPKKIEKQMTNGLDQTEVRSRLKALAETIDTRGWAVKNATLSDAYTSSPGVLTAGERLIDVATLPKAVPEIDLNQYADVLGNDNAVSAKFDHMMRQSSQSLKQQSLDKMQRVRNGESIEAVQQKQPVVNFSPPVDPAVQTQATDTIDERALSQALRSKQSTSNMANNHMQTLRLYPDSDALAGAPTAPQQGSKSATGKAQAEMTSTSSPDIMNFAHNNDLNVATIQRAAKKKDLGENEVVVSLR